MEEGKSSFNTFPDCFAVLSDILLPQCSTHQPRPSLSSVSASICSGSVNRSLCQYHPSRHRLLLGPTFNKREGLNMLCDVRCVKHSPNPVCTFVLVVKCDILENGTCCQFVESRIYAA
jgi:hypothetical protein